MSNEKVNVLKVLGAQIIRTPTAAAYNTPESLIAVAQKIQKETPNSIVLDQVFLSLSFLTCVFNIFNVGKLPSSIFKLSMINLYTRLYINAI